ncbi:serine/arginine repetitive matrix protein 5 [Bactrocera dorsalis]|uniref:Serine/arginine repetitive matrix protein 5 n=1 Tax=Bactrocera dorsalis TaxID=27457 RepID=A0A6I9UY10_BACDO|nr:serine/arginine repetitive matrix protein 5 [Bactrocera dorsalis]
MKFAKLYLVPALLLIAAVWLEIVATEYDAVYEGLLGRVVTPDFINQLTGSNGQTSNSNCGSKPIVEEVPIDGSEYVYTDYPEEATDEDKELTVSTGVDSSTPTRRTQDYDYYSSPVSSIGRNVEHNTANAISMARNQQTNRVRRRNPSRRRKQQRRRSPSRRRTQQRRRRQKRRRRPSAQRRRRPSAQKRKRPNRNNSKDRRRRRRGGQRKQHRRVIVRRRQANKRRNDERVERPQL